MAPSIFQRVRRRMPCSNLQLWGAYILVVLGILMFASLIYSKEKVLGLILICFTLGVNVFICLRLLFLQRRTTPYRRLPWSTNTDTNSDLLASSTGVTSDIETGNTSNNIHENLSPGAILRRDEMIVMQLQLLELKKARRHHASTTTTLGNPYTGRRERDRQRGLLRLGFSPFTNDNSTQSTHLQLSMLDREFGPNDYDTLLRLDEELARSQARRIPQGQPLPGGLSTSQINLFPSFIMPVIIDTGGKDQKDKDTETTIKKPLSIENCPICLDPKVPGEVLRTVPCLHTFHVQCIDPWLQLKRTCPVCKMDFAQL